MSLDAVRAAMIAARDAAAQLRAEVAKATQEGESIADIARAAEVTRQTVYRWAEEVAPERVSHPLPDVLNDALLVLGDIPAARAAREGLAASGNQAKARRVQQGLQQAGNAVRDLSAKEWATIRTGQAAAAAVLYHPHSDRWHSVTLDNN